MISLNALEQTSLLHASTVLGVGNIVILERTLHAFILLDRLAASGIDFIFKGGTSLLLHLPEPKRLSVDIDIVCIMPSDRFDEILRTEVCKNPPFLRFERLDRGAYRQPKRRHYKFYYPTPNGAINNELFILLDVVEEPCPLQSIETKEINLPFVEQTGRTNIVRIPTLDALLADKLTAFAPHTIGVPFRRETGETQEHQVFKQLFDIGQLFSADFDFAQVEINYFPVAKAEAEYKGGANSPEDALYDVIRTAFDIACLDLSRKVFTEEPLIRAGITKMRDNLIRNARFEFRDAKLFSAQAGYLAASLICGNRIQQFTPDSDTVAKLRANHFDGPLKILDRLKRTNLEVYWYWNRIQKLIPDWQPVII